MLQFSKGALIKLLSCERGLIVCKECSNVQSLFVYMISRQAGTGQTSRFAGDINTKFATANLSHTNIGLTSMDMI